MNWKFWQKEPVKVEPLVIGSFYKQKGNPFNMDELEVLDVKNGFVKYRYHCKQYQTASEGSRQEGLFRLCYERVWK